MKKKNPMLENGRKGGHRPPRLHPLTSIRFFAAALIVLQHSAGSFGISKEILSSLYTAHGVSVFFVLSGFILAYVYGTLEGKREILRFFIARFARLWPLHALTFVMAWALFPVEDGVWPLLANISMLHAWVPFKEYYFSVNHVSWGISTEFGFYLLFPLIVHRWEKRRLFTLVSAFFVSFVVIFLFDFFDLVDRSVHPPNFFGFVYISPLGRLYEFVLGMATASVFMRHAGKFRAGVKAGTLLEIAALSGACFALVFLRDCIAMLPLKSGGAGEYWMLQGGLACFFYAAMILVFAFERGYVSKLLSFRFMVVLGEISFAIYLLHQILLRYFRKNIEPDLLLANPVAYLYFWVFLLVGSYFLWTFVEKPCRKFIVEAGRKILSGEKSGRAKNTADIRNAMQPKKLFPFWNVATCVTIFVLAAPIFYDSMLVAKKNGFQMIDEERALEIAENSIEEFRNVRFGANFVLVGVVPEKRRKGSKLTVAWKSAIGQQLPYYNAVHGVDESGNILFKRARPMQEEGYLPKEGDVWAYEISISESELERAHAIAMGVFSKGGGLLKADHGPRDWNGKRLLISVKDIRSGSNRRSAW